MNRRALWELKEACKLYADNIEVYIEKGDEKSEDVKYEIVKILVSASQAMKSFF